MRRLLTLVGFMMLSLCFLGGCGDDGGGPGIPRIVETFPADGATGVSLNTAVSVSFSERMDVATLDSIYVLGAETHHVDYDNVQKKATVHLEHLLEPDSTYQVRISSYVMSEEGQHPAADAGFGFTTGPLDAEHLDDVFEGNHDIASAAPIELNTAYRMLKSSGDAERKDYFAFTLTDTAKVTAVTTLSYADTTSVGWVINWRSAEGGYYSTLGTSLGEHRLESSYYYTFLPGTYYVEIGKYYADHHFVVYHLILQTSEPCEEDPYEDNDFIEDAAPILPGQLEGLRACHVDADYYSLELVAGQTLTVTVSEVTSIGGTRRLNIYNPGYVNVTGHTDQIEPAVESWTATEDGTHYFMIQYWHDGIIYGLDVEVTGP
jgi:hypothetical protein